MSARASARRYASNLLQRLAPDAAATLAAGTAAIMAQKSARPTFRRLWDAEVSVYSQFGEDGILDFLLDALDLPRPRAVELGAGDFTECNTRFLAEYRSASVMAVDARKEICESVAELPVVWRTTVLPRCRWITPGTAAELLSDARARFGGLDLLSIDLDGNDYWVLDGLDLDGVAVVVAEYNPLFGHQLPVSVPRDDNFDRTKAHHSWLYYGASLPAFIALLGDRGFRFLGSNRACINAFFARDHPLAGFPLPVPDPHDLGRYVDWRGRVGRDQTRKLAFRSDYEALGSMADLPLVQTVTGAALKVRDATT